jgi:hypothetical protein
LPQTVTYCLLHSTPHQAFAVAAVARQRRPLHTPRHATPRIVGR